jgi:CHAD domain-containing protein
VRSPGKIDQAEKAMIDVPAEKWVPGVSAADRISDVAARTLPGRLGTVLYYLPLAAEKSEEEIEHVHQLRIWTRRARAALRLYEELIPRRRCLWMQKQLKRIRRAANDARDCDVLIERLKKMQSTLATKRWLAAVRAERAEAQMAVVAVYERLQRGNRFARRIDKLLQRVRCRCDEKTLFEAAAFGEWGRAHFIPVVEQFFAAAPADQTCEAALHQFRLCSKRLRYEMELLAGAFPEEFQTQLYPTVKAIQDRLGDINDLVTAKAFLQEKFEQVRDQRESASWRRLLINEQAALDRACQQFWEWCTPQTLRELHNGFGQLLGNSTLPETPLDRPPASPPSALYHARMQLLLTQASSPDEEGAHSEINEALPT